MCVYYQPYGHCSLSKYHLFTRLHKSLSVLIVARDLAFESVNDTDFVNVPDSLAVLKEKQS